MIVVVDECEFVKDGYILLFGWEGVFFIGFDLSEFGEWVNMVVDIDIDVVEVFFIGQGLQVFLLLCVICDWFIVLVIVVSDLLLLEIMFVFFDCGVDDVVCKFVYFCEILVCVVVICWWLKVIFNYIDIGVICVFLDGCDFEIEGEVFLFLWCECCILEYLVVNCGCCVFKMQIFSVIYGIFDEDVEENVVESYISKLCKKLCKKFGFDLIDFKCFFGYCIDWS